MEEVNYKVNKKSYGRKEFFRQRVKNKVLRGYMLRTEKRRRQGRVTSL